MPDVVGTGVIRLEVDKAGASSDVDVFIAQTEAKLNAAGYNGGKGFSAGFNKGLGSDLDKSLQGVDKSLQKVGTDLDDVKKKAEFAGGKDKSQGLGLLLTTAIALGPALVPLGAVAAAGLGAIVVGAGTAALAVKGITDEIKAGTTEGKQYSTGLADLKTGLTGLEQITAKGFLAPFQNSVTSITAQFPQLNTLVSKFSTIVGTDAQLAIHGLLGGFIALEPLFTQLGLDSENLFADFDKFANGGGLKRFSDYAIAELPQVEKTLTDLGAATVNIVKGLAPLGSLSLTGLQVLADVLKEMSPGEIEAIAAGVLAWSVANKALAATTGLGGLLEKSSLTSVTSLGTGLKGIGAATTGVIGVAVALDQVYASATHTQSGVQTLLDSISKFSSGNASGGLSALANLGYSTQLPGQGSSNTNSDKFSDPLGDSQELFNNTKQATQSASQLAAAQLDVNSAYTKALTSTASIGDYATQLGTVSENTQAAATNAKALTENTSGGQQTFGAIQVSTKAWSLALKEANGNSQDALTLIEQATVQGPAYQKVLDDTTQKQQTLNDAVNQAATATGLSADQVKNYADLLGITGDQLANGKVSASQFSAEIGSIATGIKNANPAVQALVTQMQAFAKSSGDASDKAALLGASLVAYQGDALSYAGAMADTYSANKTLTQSFKDQTDQIKQGTLAYSDSEKAAIQFGKAQDGSTTATIDFTKAGAGPLINQLSAMQDAADKAAQATYQHELATKGSAQAASDAANVFKTQTYDALVKDANQLGLTNKQAQDLATSYFNISDKDLQSTVEAVGLDDVNSTLAAVGQQLAYLTGHPFVLSVSLKATGLTADLLKNSTDLLNNNFSSAEGNIVKYYAGGGFENHTAQIAKPASSVRVWAEPETGGEAYIPLAESKRDRSIPIWKETGQKLGVYADGGVNGRASADGSNMDALIAAIHDLASRDVVLESNGTQLARLVNNQQLQLNRSR